MKKIFAIITAVFLTATIWAQSPQKMSYQAVIRNTSNQLVTTQVGMKISLLQGTENGTPVYIETQTPTPNANGLVTIEIGGGTPVTGTFAAIVWSAGPYFIKTETAIAAPLTTYTITGTSQLLSVPYALYSNSSGGGWSITGNTGLTDGTNFIGTTDNVPFNIRVNNLRAGRIDPTLYNTFWGYSAGSGNTTGNGNTAIGQIALQSNTTGLNNTASGSGALWKNTTGSNNTANGASALNFNTTGTTNTAIGTYALNNNTTGYSNTANGGVSLHFNTTGNQNTADGAGGLYNNTTGNQNTAIGGEALHDNLAGNNGVAVGYYSQYFANNTATPYDNTNTSIGYQSLRGSDTPSNNTGTDNTAIGRESLSKNTTGTSNTAIGMIALAFNTTGNRNTANGSSALFNNTTGDHNTANGASSLFSNTTGTSNTANGIGALYSNTTGYSNTANGGFSLYFNTTGNQNTADGAGGLYNNTTGNQNTAIGGEALHDNTTGDQNTAIGRDAFVTGAAFSNSTAIGYNAQVTASNMIRLGDANITSINGAVDFTVVSDGRFKKDIHENVSGLTFIMKLRPVTYHLDMNKMAVFMKTPDNLRERASEALKEKVLQTGFIAQEVENVAQELGYDFSGIDKPDNENDYYGLRYAEFTVPLVKAVQEQQKMIESLKEEVRQLKDQADHKQSALGKLEAENATLKSSFESRLKKLEEMLGAMAQK
jgi:trimeric autotransporter adhesin